VRTTSKISLSPLTASLTWAQGLIVAEIALHEMEAGRQQAPLPASLGLK
jgi:hypothetical protein